MLWNSQKFNKIIHDENVLLTVEFGEILINSIKDDFLSIFLWNYLWNYLFLVHTCKEQDQIIKCQKIRANTKLG